MITKLILIIIKICYVSVSPADYNLLGHQNGHQNTSPCLVWLILSTSPWRPTPWLPACAQAPGRVALVSLQNPPPSRVPSVFRLRLLCPPQCHLYLLSPLNSTSADSPCANLKLIHCRAIQSTKAKKKAYVCVLIFMTWQKKNILWLFTSYFQKNTFVCVYKREYDIIN